MLVPNDAVIQKWKIMANEMPQSTYVVDQLLMAVHFATFVAGETDVDVGRILSFYFVKAVWRRPSNLAATAQYCQRQGLLELTRKSRRRNVWCLTAKGYGRIFKRPN